MPSTVCLFVYLLYAIRHHQAQHVASPVDMRSGYRRRVYLLAEGPFYVLTWHMLLNHKEQLDSGLVAACGSLP